MGEAIARFREMALAMRQASDAAFIHPAHLLLDLPPTKGTAIESRLLAGKVLPRDFARLLREAAQKGKVPGRPDASEDGFGLFDHKRKRMLSQAPGSRDLDRLHAAALVEAEDAGRLFDLIERSLSALSDTTASMLTMAADSWGSRYSLVKRDYAKHLLRWQRAYDALGRFISAPPAAAGSSPKAKAKQSKKKQRSRKGIGGPKKKYSDELIREILSARDEYAMVCSRLKKPVAPFAQWLFDYCGERKPRIDTHTTFPSRYPKEPFDERANRFLKAARARLNRGGN
jgi:hypothetical protein